MIVSQHRGRCLSKYKISVDFPTGEINVLFVSVNSRFRIERHAAIIGDFVL
jgi:hypothetical protein